jgi:hypothetical protein
MFAWGIQRHTFSTNIKQATNERGLHCIQMLWDAALPLKEPVRSLPGDQYQWPQLWVKGHATSKQQVSEGGDTVASIPQ